ncbi:DUF7159 family protein [Mycolicibacterium iranicum]|uniref:DUF7159 domain-containing protein n=1 Tax=Mycolicibacterium iranicum TaxID=912594 RepID=A0A178LS63_MYCIR|nr:hypothetical protein [Mycolicibacterium iranicum]OAN35788.1 hypothetical protein A4X20_25795 [Mycolicibacterium iranicum]
MGAVLGLSVTPSAVGVVLVEGQDDDGVTLDGESFQVRRRGGSNAVATSEQAAAAVLRTEAVAADLGRRVHSIGVTWSDDANTEAALLLKSLSDSGFDNVVPVRLSEATDALARRIAQILGFRTTAVCVIEPEQLIALVVASGDDPDSASSVQTAVNHTVVTEDDLVGWLSSVFARADWEPEALVLVGSADDLDGLLPVLEDALAVPVYSPDEARLALARGAALACAQPGEFPDWATPAAGPAKQTSTKRFARFWPAALLGAGAVAFVASVSVALTLQLAPEPAAPQARPTAEALPEAPAPALRPARLSPAPAAPAPAVPAPVVEQVPVEVAPIPEEAPLVEVALPELAAPPDAAVPPAAAPPIAPPPAAVPPVPQQRPGILQRIRDRLSGVGNDDEQPPAAVPPPPPAPPPPLP